MLKLNLNAWAVIWMMIAFIFGSCADSGDDDQTIVPPSRISAALQQVYPGAQNVEWKMVEAYYVADCWVSGDELDVWFDANANWVMTENEMDTIDQLVPAVYTAFRTSTYYDSWIVKDVYVLVYPQNPTESVITIKHNGSRRALFYSQDGGLLHDFEIDDAYMNWPPALE